MGAQRGTAARLSVLAEEVRALEAENAALRAEAEELRARRDATIQAMADLRDRLWKWMVVLEPSRGGRDYYVHHFAEVRAQDCWDWERMLGVDHLHAQGLAG